MQKLKSLLIPKPDDPVLIYSVKALMRRYTIDNLTQLGGQLAYFAILSLFPFLILLNQMISMLEPGFEALSGSFYDLIPPDIAAIIKAYLLHLESAESTGVFTIGVLMTIWLSSKSVISLLFSLDKAFRSAKPLSLPKKLIGYAFTTLLLLLIFVSLIFSSVSETLFEQISRFFEISNDWSILLKMIRWNIPIAFTIVILMVLYRIIAPRDFAKKNLLIGASFSVCLLMPMSAFLSYYTANFGNYSVIYGSLGAIIILLLFLYWSGIIIVLGGELAHILEMRRIKNYSYDCPPAKSDDGAAKDSSSTV